MLIDTFLYNGEEDLLELRDQILKDYVDVFLCIEGDQTFTGKHKDITEVPYYRNMEVAIVTDFPFASVRNPWKREAYQRNQILKYLPIIGSDDIIMVSDVDEIPDPIAIDRLLEHTYPKDSVGVFEQAWYQFNFNNRVKDVWKGTRICGIDALKKHFPQGVRNYHSFIVPNGGWHFSWFWKPQEKLYDYSHIELQSMPGTIKERVEQKWEREHEFVYGTKHLPQVVQAHPELWEQYFHYDKAH